MDTNELIVVGAAIALQIITLSAWLNARYEARLYRRLYDRLAGSCVRRDPRTGRYLKTRSN